MTDMNMKANTSRNFPGRTYRFLKGNNSIYDFGHGLSYSTFTKTIISAPTTILVQTKLLLPQIGPMISLLMFQTKAARICILIMSLV